MNAMVTSLPSAERRCSRSVWSLISTYEVTAVDQRTTDAANRTIHGRKQEMQDKRMASSGLPRRFGRLVTGALVLAITSGAGACSHEPERILKDVAPQRTFVCKDVSGESPARAYRDTALPWRDIRGTIKCQAR